MSNFISLRKIEPNIKILAGPFIVLVILGVMILYTINTGLARIKIVMEEYNSITSKENYLEQKLASLKEVESSVIDQADFTLIALPQKNPASSVISKIKSSAQSESLIIEKFALKKGAEDESLGEMRVSLDIKSQDTNSYTRFLKDILSSSPFISLKETSLSLDNSEEIGYSNVLSFSFFWSDFPKTLPSITEPIKELSDEQKSILSGISNLKQVTTFTPLEPQEPSDRENPFN